MGLFGSPNIQKLQKEGNIRKLIRLQNNKNLELAEKAFAALQQITDDKDLEEHRKKYMTSWEYAGLIKRIETLAQDKQNQLKTLTDNLKEEKRLRDEKNQAIVAAREELKKPLKGLKRRMGYRPKNYLMS